MLGLLLLLVAGSSLFGAESVAGGFTNVTWVTEQGSVVWVGECRARTLDLGAGFAGDCFDIIQLFGKQPFSKRAFVERSFL